MYLHEKNMGKNFHTKKSIILLLLLTVIQCKQRYTRTSFISHYLAMLP
jgi:hypothetical protein